MTQRLLHEDDLVLSFDATQEARHAALLRANEMAKALVERAKANAAGQKPDPESGEVEGPGRLRIVVGYDREDKSTKQRAFLHAAVFPQIAEQVLPEGVSFHAKVWKEHYRALYLGDRWVLRKALVVDKATGKLRPAKRATPHRERVSTERLSVKQYSEHIDKVIAHAVTEYGVQFHFIHEEREAVRYVAPPRKKRQEQVA